MGWTAVTDVFDWSARAVVAEYVAALRERLAAVNFNMYDAPALPVEGDDVQAAAFWAGLQDWIETIPVSPNNQLYTCFVDSVAHASGFGGADDVATFTLSAFRTAAGTENGFRRVPTSKTVLVSGVYDPEAGETAITATGAAFEEDHVGCRLSVLYAGGDFEITAFDDSTHVTVAGDATSDGSRFSILPADWTDYEDPAFEFGHVQEGDVIGPWLFADLQTALNVLVWVGYPKAGTAGAVSLSASAEGEELWNFGMSDWHAVRQDAIDEAATVFNSGANKMGGADLAAWTWVVEDGGQYVALCWRKSLCLVIDTTSSEVCDIDWYAVGDTDGADPGYPLTFDRQGDFQGGYVAGKLYLWRSDEGLSDERRVSGDHYGPDSVPPNWPAGDNAGIGYSTAPAVAAAVAKWNLPGGFEFIG